MSSHEFGLSSDIIVKDKYGNIKKNININGLGSKSKVFINQNEYEFKSFLKNFIKFLYVHLKGYVGPDVTVKTTKGETIPIMDHEKWVRMDSLRDDEEPDINKGVVLGNGYSHVDSENHKLSNLYDDMRIKKYNDVDQGIMYPLGGGSVNVRNATKFKNNTNVNLNVKETGITFTVFENKMSPFETNDTVLIARDTFTNDNIVKPGGVLDVTYDISLEASRYLGFTDNFIHTIHSGIRRSSYTTTTMFDDIFHNTVILDHPLTYPNDYGLKKSVLKSSDISSNKKGIVISTDYFPPLGTYTTSFDSYIEDDKINIGDQRIEIVDNSIHISRSITVIDSLPGPINRIGFISDDNFMLFYVAVPSLNLDIGETMDIRLKLSIGY